MYLKHLEGQQRQNESKFLVEQTSKLWLYFCCCL